MPALFTSLGFLAVVVGTVVLGLLRVWWLPTPASHWGALNTMLILTFAVTGLAFVGVHLVLAYAVLRYRHDPLRRALFLPEHPRLERALIAVTAVGIVVLLAPGLAVYARVISPPQTGVERIRVEVVGQQWRWLYRFPGDDGEFGRVSPDFVSPTNPFGLDPNDPAGRDDVLVIGGPLYLPEGEPVHLLFRSTDVIHNFWVPNFRVKKDAVPGIVTDVWFVPNQAGEYQAVCAELCGVGHWAMRSKVRVVPVPEFWDWLSRQPRAEDVLTR